LPKPKNFPGVAAIVAQSSKRDSTIAAVHRRTLSDGLLVALGVLFVSMAAWLSLR
jgi:hypothetical protein